MRVLPYEPNFLAERFAQLNEVLLCCANFVIWVGAKSILVHVPSCKFDSLYFDLADSEERDQEILEVIENMVIGPLADF